MVSHAKSLLHYQGLIRVPFIWMDPADEYPGQVETGLVALRIFLIPFLRELAWLHRRACSERISIRSCQVAKRLDATGSLSSRRLPSFAGGIFLRVKTFVDLDWRLSYYAGETWGELYDLRQDPQRNSRISGPHPNIRPSGWS